MTLELKKNEQILADKAANLIRGVESVGGRLKITNQRLIFEANAINNQKQTLEIPLNQISEVIKRYTFGLIPNGLLIKLKSNVEYKFIVWNCGELIKLITKKK